MQLAWGFLCISIAGLLMIGVATALYGIVVVDGAAKSWHEHNVIVAWFLHKADSITQFVGDHVPGPPAMAPSPSSTATPSPQ
jgi:hypothetical protein